MPTVIDSLIVEIGLDPSKFTKGQKEAIASFKQAEEAAKKAGSNIESAGARGAEFFGKLQTSILAVGAALVGTKVGGALLGLTQQMIQQDAASGRLAYRLETNVGALDRFRNAAYLAGGTMEGATGFVTSLTSEWQKLAATGESSLLPFFAGLGVKFSDEKTGKMRDFADVMRDVSAAVSKLSPAQANYWLKSIGADDGSINLLIRGTSELDKYMAMAARFGNLTTEQVENARKLELAQKNVNLAYTEWFRILTNLVSGPLIKLGEFAAKTIETRGNIDKRSIFGRALEALGLGKKESTGAATPTGVGGFPSAAERVAYYRELGAKNGVSPDVLQKVVESEGLGKYVGDRGSSFGDFQLHYGGLAGGGMAVGGLGDEFTKKTGLDARDPKTWKEQAEFSVDYMKRNGLGPWHGWKGSQWAGIDRGQGGGTTNIGTIIVQTQATDAQGVAAAIGPAIQRNSAATQSQSGPQ
jgi:hypothetical protein